MPMLRSLIVLFVAVSFVSADEIEMLGGGKQTGTVKQIGEKEITFEVDSKTTAIPLSKILLIRLQKTRPVGGENYTDVKLIDSSILHCKAVSYSPKGLDVTLLSGTTIKALSLRNVVWILRDAQNEKLREQWEDVLKNKIKRDRIVVLRDGKLNPLEGTLGDVSDKGDTIDFLREGGVSRPIPLNVLHGITFYRSRALDVKPLCRVIDVYGNPITAVKMSFDGKAYSVTTNMGSDLKLSADVVAKIDFNINKLSFLSDMSPNKVVERSNIGLVVKHRKDKNQDGQPILVKDKSEGVKGLFMHAHTELEYMLGGEYKTFKATMLVDQRVGTSSKARVTIFCDGKQVFSRIASPNPESIAVRVEDVNRLRIMVSSSNALDLHDHVTLAEARVTQ